jgi:hypothetical protein
VIALLLDLANIVGGFLLAVPLLVDVPRIGDDVTRVDRLVRPFGWIVGVVALAAGGYYLIVHLTSGPHVFHFELVGIAVGVALLWDRLTGRPSPQSGPGGAVQGGGVQGTVRGGGVQGGVQGAAVLLAVFGVIGILVGVQGLFTPN